MRPPSDAAKACLAGIPEAENLGNLFGSLQQEGMASWVGDLLALAPSDLTAKTDRDRVQRGVNMVSRSVTLMAMSTHALTTPSGVSYDQVYELGFYGDEILYYLGY